MNKIEALDAMESWIKKGWRFSVDGDSTGWTCDVVGAGLAYANCGGETFETAVELALQQATAMEDNPEVILARYEKTIIEICDKVFGKGALLGFNIWEDKYDRGPRRIEYKIKSGTDVKLHVDQEEEFWRATAHLPKEITDALRIDVKWSEEAEKKA